PEHSTLSLHDALPILDGQQRLWAIWQFLDNEYPYELNGPPRTFAKMSSAEQKQILGYKLQVTVFEDADDDYLRELFLRLQLGLLDRKSTRLNSSHEWI